MKCYNHESRSAIGGCVTCGHTFCRDCLVEANNVYYCKTHFVEILKEKNAPPKKKKSKLLALVLCMFFGYLGIHRFYLGRPVTGVIWLFTGGLLFIGWWIDIILIAMDVLEEKR